MKFHAAPARSGAVTVVRDEQRVMIHRTSSSYNAVCEVLLSWQTEIRRGL